MNYSEFSWERQSPPSAVALSAADVEAIGRLMTELRDLTQSRGTFVAASNFLERFGFETDHASLVDPDQTAN